jgi:hypothetical protein
VTVLGVIRVVGNIGRARMLLLDNVCKLPLLLLGLLEDVCRL